MNNQPIGVFDSGVGGLSVFFKLIDFLPHENFLYLADVKNCPYGDKKTSQIRQLALRNIRFLLEQECKLIVLACNTLTILNINFLRKKFSPISFVGIVPPVKQAVLQSKTGHILVFSTKATQQSQYLQGLIKQFASNKKIYNLAGPGLVEIIETGQIKGRLINRLLEKFLAKPLKDPKVDIVAGGCTHYYFIQKAILDLFPQPVKFIQTSLPVARQIKRILAKDNAFALRRQFLKFFTTGDSAKFNQVFKLFCGFQIQAKKVKL